MFSEWRKRSKLMQQFYCHKDFVIYISSAAAYSIARAAFKAGVRAGIKQEQARRKK